MRSLTDGTSDPDDAATFQERRLLDSLTDYAIFAMSKSGIIVDWNAGAALTFGYAAHEVIGKPYSVIFTAEDIASGRPEAELAASRARGKAAVDGWHVRKDGSRIWCTDTVQQLVDDSGTLVGFTKIVRDSSDHHAALEGLRESEERLRLLIEGVTDYAIFSLDCDGIIRLWNPGAEIIFGYTEAEIVGRHFSTVYPAESIARGVPALEIEAAARDGKAFDESWLLRGDGETFFSSGHMTRLRAAADGRPRGFVKIARDITAAKTADETIQHRAFYDELTQLPNRSFFIECLRRSIAHGKRHPETCFAVIFLDLDRFKIINDSLGHATGDELLVHVARTLERCVRPEDMVARLGGDEFTILLSDLHDVGHAARVAARIQSALGTPFRLAGRDLFTAASLGIAIGSALTDNAEQILRDADTAMYEAKGRGRAQVVVFDAEMHARAMAQLTLQIDLRRALARHEFFVEYQPIVTLDTDRVVGFEALVRWQHPERGTLFPSDFLAEAEALGIIISIDHFVLHEACRQLRAWHVLYDDTNLTISVNLSSAHFADERLLDEVRDALASNHLVARSLKLEITETVLMDDFVTTTKTMEDVGGLGVELYIDDFGTGYSSLSYLTRLPLLKLLKVDRSFVGAISSNERNVEIARTIVTLAHNLGLKALAEGIESAAQLTALRALGCEFGQGYWFSPAVRPERAGKLIGCALPIGLAS
ncbi:MAG: hypothetical protein NVSMB21_19110 [Vulcanimicrobiaceae bacterium]